MNRRGAVWIIAYLNEITDKPEVLILSLAAVMQSSYFDYYHLTAGKKRLWTTQMGSTFWISSVIGGHHNLMLRRQQPGEHPIIDPAQESLLFRRIVAMSRFIRPVDMQQHKGVAFRRSQGCLCLGVQIRIHIASSPLYREKLHVQQPGNPLYQLLAADHGALLGKWRQCYRNRLSPQKHTSFFRQQSFKGMVQQPSPSSV